MRWARSRTALALSNVRAAAVSEIARDKGRPLSVFFKRPADRIDYILRLYRLGAIVTGGLLGCNFHMCVGRDQIVGDWNALDDLDALARQRVVFHVAHGDEAIDALETEPVDYIRHQLLETRILNARHTFGAFEILGCRIAAFLALAGVVDQEFGDFAKGTALFSIVDDDSQAAVLAGAGAFLDAVKQIGAAGADVGAEHVGAVAFVVHAARDPGAVIRQLGDVSEQIGRRPADRRQEHLQVGPRHQFRKHAGGLFEQLPAQIVFGGREPLRQARQIPDRVDRDLDHRDAAALVDHFVIMLEPPGFDRRLQLGEIKAGARDRDARADVDAFGDLGREVFSDQMSPRVQRNDALRIAPLREGSDGRGRVGVGEVR